LIRVFRIADRRAPIFDGSGARLLGGRWNSPGRPLIYAAASFAGAMLEVLVHADLGRIPQAHAVVEITIPDAVAVDAIAAADLPGWNTADQTASRAFGDAWRRAGRTAVLLVPSLVTCGWEQNALLNPEHPGFRHIHASEPQSVVWDARLFRA
jgi:RES domain-containing protein